MTLEEQLNSIKDTIAVHTAQLDQLQTKVYANRHRLNETDVWKLQAEIDVQRFNVELDRLQLNAIIDRLK